jgi:hypothetical protein
MQQLTRYCAGWIVAAVLATGVSYAAIQNLVVTAALGQPVDVADVSSIEPGPATPAPTPTATLVTLPIATPTTSKPTHSPTAHPSPRASTATPHKTVNPKPAAAASAASTTSAAPVTGYTMRGGQVTLELLSDSARLVSAVPVAGYSTQTWHTDTWIRVDFVSGTARSSLIVSWFQHPPMVVQNET